MVNKLGYWKQPQKVDAIAKWGTPTSVKEIRSFLGYVNFYRPFIERLSIIAKPLFDLTVKGRRFKWEDEHQKAFMEIKKVLTKDIILMFPKPDQPFILHFDASEVGTGAVLQQYDDHGLLRPIEFFSKKWNKAEYNYSVPDKELYGLVLALKHWYPILFGADSIMVYTDHKSLRDFSKTQLLKPRHARWALVLEDFKDRMEINWIAGRKNIVADVTSRNPHFTLNESELKERLETVMLPESVFGLTAKSHQMNFGRLLTSRKGSPCLPEGKQDDQISHDNITIEEKEVHELDEADDDTDSEHSEEEEETPPTSIKCRPHQTDISNDRNRQLDVLHTHHDNVLSGHYGYRKTLDLIMRRYWWKGLRKDVKKYIETCDVCQKSKSGRQSPHGKLIPLPIPERNWEKITMDFIVKLPKSNKYDSILVIVDRRSKMAHFIPCNETITAEGTARLVFEHIVCKHGVPQSIVSDRGPQFKSKFWKKLWALLGTKVNLSTAYHPQTDGQSERVNQTLEQYLRCFTSDEQDDWSTLLPTAELAYNNSINESIGMSPFYAVTGQNVNLEYLGEGQTSITNPPDAGRIKAHFDQIYNQLQYHLEKAQKRYKATADEHRKEDETYNVNDQVLLSTRNIRTERPTKKLDYTWIGPYRIKRQINPVTYELDLPPTMRIHNVFHTQLLKRYVKGHITDRRIIVPPPIRNEEEPPGYIIEGIVDVRKKGRGYEYLIKWKNYGVEDNTWEPRRSLADDEMLRQWHAAHPDRISPFNLMTDQQNKSRDDDTNVSVVSTLVDTSSPLNCKTHKGANEGKVMGKGSRGVKKVKSVSFHIPLKTNRRECGLGRGI
jgi:transposase InsO family protein